MKLPLVLRPEAESDIFAHRDWYNRRRAGLGEELVEAVREMFSRIREAPEQFAIVLLNVRRAKTRRFPYIVYYRAWDDRIEVIAVLHASRDARLWQRRT